MKDMLRTLTRRSFVSSRLRNVIAVLAIAITAVLFTSVTTIMFGTIQSITLMMQMQKGSKSDGEFRNMTAAQFEMMKESELIKQAVGTCKVAHDCFGCEQCSHTDHDTCKGKQQDGGKHCAAEFLNFLHHNVWFHPFKTNRMRSLFTFFSRLFFL